MTHVHFRTYIWVMDPTISIEDPRTPDVMRLLRTHLDFCHSVTPPEGVFALDVEALRRPGTTIFGIRNARVLMGTCALKIIDHQHAELKSMHVLQGERGQGLGSRLLSHVLDYAEAGNIIRVSLETGHQEPFAAARELYVRTGFRMSGPFADYPESPYSVFMTMDLPR